jgi:acetyl esterase/lipase
MKFSTKTLTALLFAFGALTHSAAEKIIPLYDGTPRGSETWTKPEQSKTNASGVIDSVWNVINPSLTFFAPAQDKANGAAVIICPGGAFMNLAIDHEGYAVARFLAARGIASFVLKYRTVQRDDSESAFKSFGQAGSVAQLSLEDARNAIKHLKARAKEYAIDPEKVGMLGFSAGGLLTARIAYDYTPETRLAFAAPIYGAADIEKDGNKVPTDAPPLFLVAATDDFMFAPATATLYQSWIKAKRSAELHIYSKGGHGFGMKKQSLPSDTWCDRFADWLEAQGMLKIQ